MSKFRTAARCGLLAALLALGACNKTPVPTVMEAAPAASASPNVSAI